jgi:hypothetical protein
MNEWSESRHSPDLRCLFPLSIEQKSFNFNTSHSTYDNKFLLRRLCRFVHWLEWTNFSLSLTQLTTLFLFYSYFFTTQFHSWNSLIESYILCMNENKKIKREMKEEWVLREFYSYVFVEVIKEMHVYIQ